MASVMNVSDKIRFMRRLKGWSQEEMAEKLEMSPNGYANIERGETDVQISRLEQIAKIFGMDLTELMSFGERNILYFFGDNNQHVLQALNASPETLMIELQKCQALLQQKDKEIQYLKEIIDLLKKTGASS